MHAHDACSRIQDDHLLGSIPRLTSRLQTLDLESSTDDVFLDSRFEPVADISDSPHALIGLEASGTASPLDMNAKCSPFSKRRGRKIPSIAENGSPISGIDKLEQQRQKREAQGKCIVTTLQPSVPSTIFLDFFAYVFALIIHGFYSAFITDIKRKHIIDELLDKEEKFVANLATIIEVQLEFFILFFCNKPCPCFLRGWNFTRCCQRSSRCSRLRLSLQSCCRPPRLPSSSRILINSSSFTGLFGY
jgi:hypothetical protein